MLDEKNKQIENEKKETVVSSETTKQTEENQPIPKENLNTSDVKSDVKSEEESQPKKESSKETKIADYSILSLEELHTVLKELISTGKISSIRNEVNAIKKAYDKKFTELIAAKKKEFVDAGGNAIDFHFKSEEKYAFNDTLKEYKKQTQQHFKQLEDQRNANFIAKTEIIGKIKDLVSNAESSTLYNEFKELREQFFQLGPVPHDKNEDTWQTYRFYEQQVYDVLHLKSDLRDLDFKHNLVEKTKLVERAEAIAKEENVDDAFKELQILHRLWKEDIGPVAREFRDTIWDRFKAATEEIHNKRHALMAELEAKWEKNIPKKEAILEKIEELVKEDINSHNGWQSKIKEMQVLRDTYFNIGKLPKEKSEEFWQKLKKLTKTFNKNKNNFYKDLKQSYQDNLDKKQALIDKANELKDSDDLEKTTDLYKKIQAEWKTIGHVPKKFSDKMWKEFRNACNHFFDRLHAEKDEANKELIAVFEEKKEYLKNLKESLSDEAEVAIDDVKKFIKEWKSFGNVPSNMRFIDSKFNKVIDQLFSKLDMDKRDSAMMRFKNNIDNSIESNDTRKLEKEAFFIRKKIEDITKEIKLLENNLGFFSNATPDNPLVKNVYKNIKKHQEDLTIWKDKLNYLRSLD